MKQTKKTGRTPATGKTGKGNGDEQAAIAMALYSYLGGLHDIESDVITINRSHQPASQWCAKILNMRNLR